ncbi:MAG: GNAT family protein [Gemmataceae bacterium]
MNSQFTPVLTGKTVRLEPLAEHHREPLRLAAQDERIWEFNITTALGPAFDPWFDMALAGQSAGTRIPFAVVRIADNSVIGSTSLLDPIVNHGRVDIGHTWYLPATWRTKVNPECKLLLMTYAFESMHMRRVGFTIDGINIRSQKAVEKFGAVREGVMRQHAVVYTGRIRDTVIYSVLQSEWTSVQNRLQGRIDAN